jgi:hypothetical protein
MITSTLDGAHPNPSTYRTEKVIVVVGDPDPGEARPLESDGAGCDAPLQLAASTRSAFAGARTDSVASATANANANASACVLRCGMCGGSPSVAFVPDTWTSGPGTNV